MTRALSVHDFLLGLRRRRPVPLVLQQERSECGLAVIAMVAGHYGRQAGLHALRNMASLSSRGTTLKDLIEIAGELHLLARPLRLQLREIRKLQLPAILHWRMNHFVVLVRTKRGKVIVHDPATGRRVIGTAELDQAFTGIAVELTPAREFEETAAERGVSIFAFFGSFRRLSRYLIVMLLLLVTTQVLALVPPIATQLLIDEVVLGQDRAWLNRALAGLAAIMFVGVLIDALRRWIGLYAGTKLAADSTLSVLHHLLRLPASFLDQRHLGDLMSKVESLTPIQKALTEWTINGIVQLVILVSTITLMFAYSVWLTVVSLAGMLLSALLASAVLPASRRLSEEALVHTARQNSSLLETLAGYDSVQALDVAAMRLTQWQRHFFAAINANVRQAKLSIVSGAGTGLIGAVEQVLFLSVGISGIVEKHITLGVLFAFISLRSRFGNAVLSLAGTTRSLFLLRVHTDRISDILLAEAQQPSQRHAIRASVRGAIEARRLSFRYPGGPWIVRDLSFAIARGETAAIAGPSGKGKSTLLRLLSGLLPAVGGQVLIDGKELALWNSRCLRRQVGIVLQNDRLFQGSIAENIAAFDPEPDLGRVRRAAIKSEIWTDIQALPMTVYTLIGHSGTGLSGGQQQRLLLARAIYRDPRILFLDEATSHLDIETEKRILASLAESGITIVSAAHRPEALARADRVIDLGK